MHQAKQTKHHYSGLSFFFLFFQNLLYLKNSKAAIFKKFRSTSKEDIDQFLNKKFRFASKKDTNNFLLKKNSDSLDAN